MEKPTAPIITIISTPRSNEKVLQKVYDVMEGNCIVQLTKDEAELLANQTEHYKINITNGPLKEEANSKIQQ